MRARRAVRVRRAIRQGLAFACGAAWWWAALRFAFAYGSRPGLGEGAALAGWSLGLIPLHAVPAFPRSAADDGRGSPRRWRLRATTTRAAAAAAEPAPAPAGLGPALPGTGADPAASGQEPEGTGPR